MDAPLSTLLPSPEALPCAEVTITSGETVILRRVLPAGDYTMGRDAACDLVVDVPGISRRHATLSLGDRTTRLQDLDSMNGTFIDGHVWRYGCVRTARRSPWKRRNARLSGRPPSLAMNLRPAQR